MNISISFVGSLYITGGSLLNQVDVVDLSSGETSRSPSMRHMRVWHAAAASPTSLFVFGGGDFSDAADKSVEVFNPRTMQ